jgi:hypothetical protein
MGKPVLNLNGNTANLHVLKFSVQGLAIFMVCVCSL